MNTLDCCLTSPFTPLNIKGNTVSLLAYMKSVIFNPLLVCTCSSVFLQPSLMGRLQISFADIWEQHFGKFSFTYAEVTIAHMPPNICIEYVQVIYLLWKNNKVGQNQIKKEKSESRGSYRKILTKLSLPDIFTFIIRKVQYFLFM